MSDVVPLKKVELYVNHEATDRVAALLERLRAGDVVAMAFVEVARGGRVATAYSNSEMGHYHSLMSGASRLQHRLASVGDDD